MVLNCQRYRNLVDPSLTLCRSQQRYMKIHLLLVAVLCTGLGMAQQPSLGLSDGFISFDTPTFSVQLVKDSQTLYSLTTNNASGGFNFIQTDQMTLRQYNGNYHLGDVTFRVRTVGSQTWIQGDTSVARKPVTAGATSGSTVASANLSPTLPTTPLNIVRRWVVTNGTLQLLFDVTNVANTSVEIGSLGAPLEFNNVSLFS